MSLVRLSLARRSSSASRNSTAGDAARLVAALAASGHQRRSLAASVPRASSGAAPASSSSSSSSGPFDGSTGSASTKAAPSLKPLKAFYSPPPVSDTPPPSKLRASPTRKARTIFELMPEAPPVPLSSGLPRDPRLRKPTEGETSYIGPATMDAPATPKPDPFRAVEAEARALRERVRRQPAPTSTDSRVIFSTFDASARPDDYRQRSDVGINGGRSREQELGSSRGTAYARRPPVEDGPGRWRDDRPSRDDWPSCDADVRPASGSRSYDRPAASRRDRPAPLEARVAQLGPAVEDALDGVHRFRRAPKSKEPEYTIDDRFDVPGYAPPPSRPLAYRSPNRPDEERYEDKPAVERFKKRERTEDPEIWGQLAQVDRLEVSRLRMAEMKREVDEKAAAELGGKKSAPRSEPTGPASPGFSFDTDSFEAAVPKPRERHEPRPVERRPKPIEVEDDSFDFPDEGAVEGDEARLRRWEEQAMKRQETKHSGHFPPAAGGKKSVARFLGLNVRDEVAALISTNFPHIEEPTKFQRQLLSKVATGHDVIAQQATGSGKTFSILLALLTLERRTTKIPGLKAPQSAALMIVPTDALARQVMEWAALMVPPEQLEQTIQYFDPASHLPFPKRLQPPNIVLTTNDAVTAESVAPMRALALQTLAIDEADVFFDARTRRKEAMTAIKKMLTSGFQHSLSKNPERRKPQVIAVGSTVSPTIMRYLKETTQIVRPAVDVIYQGLKEGDKTDGTPMKAWSRIVWGGKLPESTTYHTPELARIAHHVLVVSPSGNVRNLTAPAPLGRDLESYPPSEVDVDGRPSTRVPSPILDAFKSLYKSTVSGEAPATGRSLLVLRDQAAVEDARSRLAEAGISARTLPITARWKDEAAAVGTLLITDTVSCRGLDFADLTTIYTTGGAIAGAADYVHIAGRLARLNSITGGDEAGGRVITLVQGDTEEPPAEKAARLEGMAAWLKRKESRARRWKKGGLALTEAHQQAEEAEFARKFPVVLSWEVEKMKVALSTLDAQPSELPLP